MIDKSERLSFPVNVPETRDFLPGIGAKEIVAIVIGLVIDVMVVLGIYKATSENLPLAVLIGAFIVASIILLVKRDRFNESMIDKIKYAYEFNQAQHIYEYEYFNDYYVPEEKDADDE